MVEPLYICKFPQNSIMILKHYIVIISTLLTISSFAQQATFQFPQQELNKFNAEALKRIRSNESIPDYSGYPDGISPAAGVVLRYRETRPLSGVITSTKEKSFIIADTLFIGDTLENYRRMASKRTDRHLQFRLIAFLQG
jgi:hypothetical protein